MKTKTFDCVEMKHEAGKRIYEALKNKTVAEQMDYWRSVSERFRQRRQERKQGSSSVAS